jgi:hypothetical protein
MTAIAVIAAVLAVTGWLMVRRLHDAPTDIAQFVLTIPDDQWRKP